MPSYFWCDLSEIPPELMTRNFTPAHLLWAGAGVLLLALALLVSPRLSPRARRRTLVCLAGLLPATEAAVWIWAGVRGCFTPQDMLPLHLCGVSVFAESGAVFSRSKLLREFTYALSLPAALLAIAMPGWTYPLFSFRYLMAAFGHLLLALVPLLLIRIGGFRPHPRRLPGCFGLLLLCAALAWGANTLFQGNYLFLRYPPEDTLLDALYRWFGHPGYLLASVGVLGLVWALLYLPWAVAARRPKPAGTPAEVS